MPRQRNIEANTLQPVNEFNEDGMRRELARLREENDRLAEVAVTALKRAGTEKEPEPEPVIEHKKLYFIGERLEKGAQGQPDHLVTDLMWDDRVGLHHTCSRGPTPILFKGSNDDNAPHAFVPVPFGNWLIAEDGARDRLGRLIKARYRWAGEA